MTTSTNALLYYGFTFLDEDEETPPWEKEDDEDYDSDQWLCDNLGGPKESDWEAQSAFVEALPIMIGYHCYIDASMYFICARESYHVAHRGHPVQLRDSIVKNLGWDPTLADYCEKLGIKWQQPQWELASLWS